MSFEYRDVKNDINDIKTALTGLEKEYTRTRSTLIAHQQVHTRLTNISEQLNLSIKQQMELMKKAQQVTQKTTKATTSSTTSTKDFAKAITESVKEVIEQEKAAKEAAMATRDLGHGFTEAGVPITDFNKRTALVGKTLKRLRDEYGILQFEISKSEVFDIYKQEGGNAFEFLAEFIAGTREEISIFGFEAAKARKVLYGFAPPGTFRVLNKFASVFQFIGGTIRRTSANAEENNNILGNTMKIMGKLTKQGKGVSPFKAFSENYKLLETNVNKAQAALDATTEKIEEKKKELKAAGKTDAQISKATAKLRGKKRRQQTALDEATKKRDEESLFPENLSRGFKSAMDAIKENSKAMGGMGVLGQLGRLRGKRPLGIKSAIRGGFDRAIGVDPALIKGTAEAQIARDEKIKELKGQGITLKGDKKKFDKEMEPFEKALEEALGKQKDARGEKLKKIQEKVGKFVLGGVKGAWNAIKFVFKMAVKYLVIGGMALIAIGVIATKILPTIIEHFAFAMDMLGVFLEFVSPVFTAIFDGLDKIINGFIDGDLEEIMLGVGEFALGVLGTLAVAFIALGYTLLAIGVTFVTGIFTKAYNFLLGGKGTAKTIFGRAVVLISAILLGIKLATLLNSPAFIAVAIMGVLFVALKWLAKKLDFFAEGGVSAGGLAVVGEKGPELVNLPRGSRVHSNADSRKMVSGGGSVVNNISVTINAKDTSKSEMRRIAKEIGNMINKEVNRGVSSSTTR